MQRLQPEQQNSSLGISKALKEEVRLLGENSNGNNGQSSSGSNAIRKRSTLTDAHFNKVPTSEANIFTWTRFIISLYYNKVQRELSFRNCSYIFTKHYLFYEQLAVNMFGFLTGWKWYNR